MVHVARRGSAGRDEKGYLPQARIGIRYADFIRLLVPASGVALHYYCTLGTPEREVPDLRGEVRDLLVFMERHVVACNEQGRAYHLAETSSSWCWELCRLMRRDVKLFPLRLLEALEESHLNKRIHPTEHGPLATLRMIFNNKSSVTMVGLVTLSKRWRSDATTGETTARISCRFRQRFQCADFEPSYIFHRKFDRTIGAS
jgi:hypothetical protein